MIRVQPVDAPDKKRSFHRTNNVHFSTYRRLVGVVGIKD
jgi:hypothetical protein